MILFHYKIFIGFSKSIRQRIKWRKKMFLHNFEENCGMFMEKKEIPGHFFVWNFLLTPIFSDIQSFHFARPMESLFISNSCYFRRRSCTSFVWQKKKFSNIKIERFLFKKSLSSFVIYTEHWIQDISRRNLYDNSTILQSFQ